VHTSKISAIILSTFACAAAQEDWDKEPRLYKASDYDRIHGAAVLAVMVSGLKKEAEFETLLQAARTKYGNNQLA